MTQGRMASLPDIEREWKPARELRRVRSLTAVATTQYEERVERFATRLATAMLSIDGIFTENCEKSHINLATSSDICSDLQHYMSKYDELTADYIGYLQRQKSKQANREASDHILVADDLTQG